MVIDIFVIIIEELRVYLLHLLKESQEFLHIVFCFLPRELVLPAVRNNNILAALGTYRKCTSELHEIDEISFFVLVNVPVHQVTAGAPHKVQSS